MADIIANTEELAQVVNDFASQLENYMKVMNTELSNINSAMEVLSEGWTGSKYDAFKSLMDERISTIRAEMDKCEKLKKWLEERAEDYRIMMEVLGDVGKI